MQSSSESLRASGALVCAWVSKGALAIKASSPKILIAGEDRGNGFISSNKAAPESSCGCSFQTVRHRLPFTAFRDGFDHNQGRTRFIAAMQLSIYGAGERFGVMRDNADAGEILRSGDVRMGDDMALSQGLVIRAKLGAQILTIPPTPKDELYVGGVMLDRKSTRLNSSHSQI